MVEYNFLTMSLWAVIMIALIVAMLINFISAGKLECVCDAESIKSAKTMTLTYAIIVTCLLAIMLAFLIGSIMWGKDAIEGVKSLNRVVLFIMIVIIALVTALAWWTFASINSLYKEYVELVDAGSEVDKNFFKRSRMITLGGGIMLLVSIIIGVSLFVTLGYEESCKFKFSNLSRSVAPNVSAAEREMEANYAAQIGTVVGEKTGQMNAYMKEGWAEAERAAAYAYNKCESCTDPQKLAVQKEKVCGPGKPSCEKFEEIFQNCKRNCSQDIDKLKNAVDRHADYI